MPGKKRQSPGTIRIIGGDWRGRKLSVADVDGLRPSGSRLRETLFNWLQNDIHGLRCLDLYAGTGALGLEALSRGAKFTQFVELNAQAARAIQNNIEILQAPAHIHQGKAADFLHDYRGEKFDLVFIDPPFAENLWDETVAMIGAYLNPNAYIYVETPAKKSFSIPTNLKVEKSKTMGEVQALLLIS